MSLVAAVLSSLVLKAERPRLFIEAADLPRLRDAWCCPSRARASAELFRYCRNRLDEPPDAWSGSDWPLEPAMSLAFVALAEGTRALDESPGGRMAAKALSLARSFASSEPGNARKTLAVAVVYDWLYDLIDLEDRARLRRALRKHIEYHLARGDRDSSFAARASLLACADELPEGRQLLARSRAKSPIDRVFFGGLNPAEASAVASAFVAPSLLARISHPHPSPEERALILSAAHEGSEEARWAVRFLGDPEEPWLRVYEFLWPSEERGFPPEPYAKCSLPPRAVARESWEAEAFVASAGPEGGSVCKGGGGIEFFRERARSAGAGCAGGFSCVRAEYGSGIFEAVIVRGLGTLVRLRTPRAARELSFRARGNLEPALLWPQGTVARDRERVRVTSGKWSAEFVFAIPKTSEARREPGYYVVGDACVVFADGRESIALDIVGRRLRRVMICGLEEGEYQLRLSGRDPGAKVRKVAATAAGLLAVEIPGGEATLRLRKEER